MSAASAPPWPGSRILLAWWRELQRHRPHQLWFGRLSLHRIESLVRVSRTRSLDPWHHALLRLISTRLPCGELESSLNDLQMDRQVLARFFREWTDAGLLYPNGTGVWDLTVAGQHALETGLLIDPLEERRTFYFLDNSSLRRPPHFLPLRLPPAAASPPAPDIAEWSFDLASLEACLRQTPAWKARYHFPADVEALLPPRPEDSPAANWRCVILNRAEQRAFAFIRTAGAVGEPSLLAFAVRAEDWGLDMEPVLVLTEGWQEVLPDLAEEPPMEEWRQAWRAWCQPRSLSTADIEACRLERADHRLLVHAPHRLIERLRAARSDAVKQEAWLLAGAGRLRTAAQVELLPS